MNRLRKLSDDRGDVPGWVLITLMTAGLVIIIWGLAGPGGLGLGRVRGHLARVPRVGVWLADGGLRVVRPLGRGLAAVACVGRRRLVTCPRADRHAVIVGARPGRRRRPVRRGVGNCTP